MLPETERRRVIVQHVRPEVDGGRFPIKRTVGEEVEVWAEIFADGHDVLAAVVRYRGPEHEEWLEAPMSPGPPGTDTFSGTFRATTLGRWEYTVEGWVDRFASWRHGFSRKVGANADDLPSELLEGAIHLEAAASRAKGDAARALTTAASTLKDTRAHLNDRVQAALDPRTADVASRHPDRSQAVMYERVLGLIVEPERARFGAWYEFFPRSAGPDPTRSATLREASSRLIEIARMGFDVVYLPPIHPIGRTHRKGKNNSLVAQEGDVGSPWAIGSEEGGHTAVHPDLGTIEDFDRFVEQARRLDLQIALDIAFQCSPDHPWAKQHPEWFKHRPDGTIKYAENPPKKYQDIYPLDFECEAWRSLWQALLDVFLFWCRHGVTIFRVDNPHTKSFRFWEWCLHEVRKQHPEAIFLSEAFTRPTLLYYLAKAGYSQSYTYFTWRNTKQELTSYFEELTQTPVREFMRPNLFANTPDILHAYLQFGGRAAFIVRLVLASTLGASYGIYSGFELCEGTAVKGTEEYLDSEKYQIRHWDWHRPGNIIPLVQRMNEIRRENPALHHDWSLRFHPTDNDHIIFYSKTSGDNVILVAVNLDPHNVQGGWVQVPLETLGLDERTPFQVHDLISDARYIWSGRASFVRLDPHVMPVHVLRLRRKIRTEQDFDYYA